MAEVSLHGVTKMYGKDVGIADVDLTIPDGAFVVLLGPTGAGKTTTLRLIAGLEKPDSGTIKIDGRDVAAATPAMRDVAMVFQQYSLYPHLTVRQNLEFPLKSPILKTPQAEIDRKVEEVAEVLHIPHKLNNKATELSGGEMQRVSIGRALVRDPSIYLMDEPLSSLDAKLRSDLRIELKRIHADLGATLLYVTHDQIEAMTMATHVGVLDNGNLVQFGSPREIYENPVSEYVATRLGLPRINLLPANTFDGAPANAERVGLRPEHIKLSKKPTAGAREAQINRIEHLGDQTRVHLKLNDQPLITLTDAHTDLTNGSTVHVNANGGLYFNSSGARIA
ncbi:MAG: ABC transporter ATP-binding protein [Pseudomonadota bacterium]